MRSELVTTWERSSASREQMLAHLQDWIQRAEASGIQALQEAALSIRSYQLCPPQALARQKKKPGLAGLFLFCVSLKLRSYLSFISLYATCLRATGSNLMNASLSGVVRLFLVVV